MQLHPDDFWELTFSELTAMIAGHQERQTEQYRHTRWIMYAAFNSQPRKKPVKLEDIFQLPGDVPNGATDDEMMEHLKMMGVDINKLKK